MGALGGSQSHRCSFGILGSLEGFGNLWVLSALGGSEGQQSR